MNDYPETHVDTIPDHVNDQDGHISLFLMGLAIVLLLLLILSIVMAMD